MEQSSRRGRGRATWREAAPRTGKTSSRSAGRPGWLRLRLIVEATDHEAAVARVNRIGALVRGAVRSTDVDLYGKFPGTWEAWLDLPLRARSPDEALARAVRLTARIADPWQDGSWLESGRAEVDRTFRGHRDAATNAVGGLRFAWAIGSWPG